MPGGHCFLPRTAGGRPNPKYPPLFNALAFAGPTGYPPPVKFQKLAILGVGLLGGSVGLAVRQRRLAGEVAGYVRRSASLAECEQAGALDYATTDVLAAVSQADLVILCTPLGQMRAITTQLLPALKAGAIVTDVGSTKESVIRDVETLVNRAGAHFVGSHPMAGGEKSGVLAGRADLFDDAICVITPTKKSHAPSVKAVTAFWKTLGARTILMSAREHDVLVGRSSHLPHIVAAALASQVLRPQHPPAQGRLCATGFRDTTRIASGSPEMWRDICLANRTNLSRAVGSYITELTKFQTALDKADGPAIAKFFAIAKQRRDEWGAE